VVGPSKPILASFSDPDFGLFLDLAFVSRWQQQQQQVDGYVNGEKLPVATHKWMREMSNHAWTEGSCQRRCAADSPFMLSITKRWYTIDSPNTEGLLSTEVEREREEERRKQSLDAGRWWIWCAKEEMTSQSSSPCLSSETIRKDSGLFYRATWRDCWKCCLEQNGYI
jgi:hypothetical protein